MAQLPPKIPPQMTSNWPIFPVHQNNNNQTSGGLPPPPTLSYMAAPTSTSTSNQHHHNIPNPNLSWVDEFLGFTSTRRGHHRRSISDGVTFIETAGSFAQFGDHQDRQIHDHNNSFDRLDDDHQLILSMFNDDMSLDMPPAFTSNTAMSSPLSTPSEQNSNNEDQVKPCQLSENLLHLQEALHQPQSLKEDVDGSNKLSMESLGLQSSTDGSFKADPKRVKRILANRQSAQRSRVRKLQYISELERTVTQLQSEVSALSPSVAFLDHQRLELNVNNSALKQRIAALAQDKLFKDAHQEALKREIERLRQIYLQQTLNNDQKISEDNSNNYNSSSKMINNNNIGTARTIQLSTPDMSITCNDK